MNYAPIARIVVRYGAGIVFGAQAGELLAGNPDVIAIAALAIGAAVEGLYARAKQKGWAT